jgi:hypothetical protein
MPLPGSSSRDASPRKLLTGFPAGALKNYHGLIGATHDRARHIILSA